MSAETGIDQGRAAFREHRWTDAFENFRDADQKGGLPAQDLERLATAEIPTGNLTIGPETLTRAHEEYLVLGDLVGAALIPGRFTAVSTSRVSGRRPACPGGRNQAGRIECHLVHRFPA